MPEVSSIKTKIDFSTEELDRAQVQIELFGREVERKLEPAGKAFVTFGKTAEETSIRIESATAKTRGDLDRLGERAQAWARDSGQAFEAGSRAVLKLGADGEAALARLSTGLQNTGNAATGLWASLSSLGVGSIPAGVAIAGLAVVLTTILAPALSYVAGLLATLTLATGILGGFALLGAGVIALAEHYNNWAEAAKSVTTAQNQLATATNQQENALEALKIAQLVYDAKPTAVNLQRLQDAQEQATESTQKMTDAQTKLTAATAAADNPWTKLTANLNQMALTLGQQATPLAERLLNWLNSLIPSVEKLGASLIAWFGPRMTDILAVAQVMFRDLLTGLENLGRKVGPFFDDLAKNPERYEKAFRQSLDGISKAIVGGLGDLDQLSKWWAKDGQRMAKDAEIAFKIIGTAIEVILLDLELLATVVKNTEGAFDRLGSTIQWALGLWNAWQRQGAHDVLPPDVREARFPNYVGTHQHGGMIPIGGWGRVGEVASELVYSTPAGAMVVPESGGERGGGLTVNVNAAGYVGPDTIRQLIRDFTWELKGNSTLRHYFAKAITSPVF